MDRALGYVELYGAYAECEAVYCVDELLALGGARRGRPGAVRVRPPGHRWPHYVRDVHLPSIVEQARVRTEPGTKAESEPRGATPQAQVLAPERHHNAFDLENTLIASNVVASYAWLATRRLPTEDRVRFVARTLAEAPGLLALDRRDRSDFLRHFYRRYERAGRPDRSGRRRAVQRPHPHQVVPQRHPPGP